MNEDLKYILVIIAAIAVGVGSVWLKTAHYLECREAGFSILFCLF